MSFGAIIVFVCLGLLDVLEMFGPGDFYEHRHQDGRQHGVARVIRQANWQKTEHYWFGRLPIPKILVQDINSNYQSGQEQDFAVLSCSRA